MVLDCFEDGGVHVFSERGEDLLVGRRQDGVFGWDDFSCGGVGNRDDGGCAVYHAGYIVREVFCDGVELGLRVAGQGDGEGGSECSREESGEC